MSIQFGDILQHNNLLYPIVDINDVKGGLRSIATFSSPALVSEYASIPEKYRSGYSLLLETSTGTIYYLAGVDPTNVSHWSPVGVGGNGYGVPNTIPKWTSSSILGNSNITDNGDTITINGNLIVDDIGNSYNISKGISNTLFGYGSQMYSLNDAGISIVSFSQGNYDYTPGIYEEVQTTLYSGPAATTYPIVNIEVTSYEEDFVTYIYISSVQIVTNGTGFTSNLTKLTADFGGGTGFYIDIDVIGIFNTSFGYNSLLSNFGKYNTGIGANSLYSNTTGNYNTGIGANSLYSNTTGLYNSAFGYNSLYNNINGSYNSVVGYNSLYSNTIGNFNNAFGYQSLYSNTSGSYNIAIGLNSLYRNTSGSFNSAIGYQSLNSNTTGYNNTALGYNSLQSNTTTISSFGPITPGSGYLPGTYSNVQLIYATGSTAITYPNATIVVGVTGEVTSVVTGTNLGSGFKEDSTFPSSSYTRMTVNNSSLGGTGSGFQVGVLTLSVGSNNTAVGVSSLFNNKTGSFNSAFGNIALSNNQSGIENSAFGYYALSGNSTGNGNVSVGKMSMLFNTTGSYNTVIGWQALPRNTTSDGSCAFGRNTLFYSLTGSENSGFGNAALYYNTLGSFNVGFGSHAGVSITTGVATLGTFSGGNGYTPGTYSGVQLNYSSGPTTNGVLSDYPLANIVVGTGGTISSVTLETSGKTFATSSTIMTSNSYSLSIVDAGPGYTASSTFSNVQLSYISGGTAITYPVVTVYTGSGGTVSAVTLVTNGSGFQDNTTIMGANLGTGTFSVKVVENSIGPGTGFTIRINSIQTANYNTAIGTNALYFNTIGSNNTALGNQAGSYTSTGNNNISDNSVFIGHYSRAQLSNQINQIVIGYDVYGNGSNTVTLGNDSILKTYLKGSVQLPTMPTTSAGSYTILTRNDITGEVEKILPMYKVYTALLTQSGTASPTAIVLENTLGVTITFDYSSIGVYTLTATGALTVNKTWIIFNNVDSNAGTITYNGKGLSGFIIITRNLGGTTANDLLNLTEIEIRVYN